MKNGNLMNRELTIATCQFPVSADIKKNESFILKQLVLAKVKGADIAHFSESSLSGYAGIDFSSFKGRDEILLQTCLENIRKSSKNLKIWTIVGGHQFEKRHKKPFNCLWLINDKGEIVDRYDKRICAGKHGELEHLYYKPGKKPIQFKLKEFTCGLLICHEWRYPELYREYKHLGSEVIFQSWYDGNLSQKLYLNEGRELGDLITGTVRGNAANNYLWISASNTGKRESSFASFVARPDGKIDQQLRRNITGILITKVNLKKQYIDPSGPWRRRVYKGILHNQ
jgi:predicted amidohydrolase